MKRKTHTETCLLAGIVTLQKGHTLEQFMKSCSLWSALTVKLVQNCVHWEGPCARAGEECEFYLRGGRVAEIMCN